MAYTMGWLTNRTGPIMGMSDSTGMRIDGRIAGAAEGVARAATHAARSQ